MRNAACVFVLAIAALFGGLQAASAQATRTWVSGVGDDVNPCSRTAPCKTFAGAISKTAAGGEISVMDPGGFGSVTITKSISIVADGSEGSILGAGTTGIIVNAGVNDFVSIRGLNIEGAGTGINGIRILQAANVHIADTVIRGFRGGVGRGVAVESATAATRVMMSNVSVYDNVVGVFVRGGTNFNLVYIDRSLIDNNSSKSLILETVKAVAHISASRLLHTPISLSGGAGLGSTGDNYIVGTVGPTVQEALR